MVTWETARGLSEDEAFQSQDLLSFTSLYEVANRAYFKPKEEMLDTVNTHMYAATGCGHTAVVLDDSIFFYENSTWSLKMQWLNTGVPIDIVMFVPPEGQLVVIGTRDGTVHCLYLESQAILMKRSLRTLQDGDRSPYDQTADTFFVGSGSFVDHDSIASFVLVTCSGQLFRIGNIDLAVVYETIKSGSLDYADDFQSGMTFYVTSIVLTKYCKVQINNSSLHIVNDDQLTVWSANETELHIYSSSDIGSPGSCHVSTVPIGLCRKIVPVYSGRYLLCLSDKGTINVISTLTYQMVIIRQLKGFRILQFQCLPGEPKNIQLLLLLMKEDGKFLLRIVSFKSFATVYEIAVGADTVLADVGVGCEATAFLEGSDMNSCKQHVGYKLNIIVDGVPETRLTKLLNSKKFKDAEEFCKRFQLDLSQVYKAKCKYYCQLLSPWASGSGNTTIEIGKGNLDELFVVMSLISDVEFVAMTCVKAEMPDVASTKRLLGYAKERLAGTAQTMEGDRLNDQMQIVSNHLYRLQTFEMVYPPCEDIRRWLEFFDRKMLDEFLHQLAKGQLDHASTIWHRHQFEFRDQIKEDCLNLILESVPNDLKSSVLASWLSKNVFGDLLQFLPNSFNLIAEWAMKRIRKFEIQERIIWPQCGLHFATTLIALVEDVNKNAADDGCLLSGGHLSSSLTAGSSLCQLRQSLQEIYTLYTNFHVRISISKYMQNDKTEVVSELLAWLYGGDEVEPLMSGFLRSYMSCHGVNCDMALSQFVHDTLAATGVRWWVEQEAIWEDKLYAVIRCMSSAKMQVHCILKCLQQAPVPWSDNTKSICNFGIALNTSSNHELLRQLRMMDLKVVMWKYGLHQVDAENERNSTFLLQAITEKCISNADGIGNVLKAVGGLEGTSVAEASSGYLARLLTLSCYNEAKECISAMDDVLRSEVSHHLVIHVWWKLSDAPITSRCRNKLKAMTGGMVALENVLRQSNNDADRSDMFDMFRRLNLLQAKYDIYPTPNDIKSNAVCQSLLEKHIMAWYKEGRRLLASDVTTDTQKGKQIESTTELPDKGGLPSLYFLALLLKVSQSQLETLLAKVALESGCLDEATHFCRLVMQNSSCQDHIMIICKLLILMDERMKTNGVSEIHFSSLISERSTSDYLEKLTAILYELTSSALTSVHPDLLSPLNEVAQVAHIATSLACHYGHSGVFLTSAINAINIDTKWNFSPLFADPNMRIEIGPVASFLSESFGMCVKTMLDNGYGMGHAPAVPYMVENSWLVKLGKNGPLLEALRTLITHLKERGQDLVAATLTLMMLQMRDPCAQQTTIATPYPAMMFVQTLLSKVFSGKHPDVMFAISLLLILTKKESLKILGDLAKRFLADYSRLLTISKVGENYCQLVMVPPDVKNQFNDLRRRAFWGHRLGVLGVSLKDVFGVQGIGAFVMEGTLPKDLMQHPECSTEFIREFCNDFNRDYLQTMLQCLRCNLQSWSPQLPNDQHLEASLNAEIPLALMLRCHRIIAEISNNEALVPTLQNVFNELSGYNYEMLGFVLQILLPLSSEEEKEKIKRDLDVLKFLRKYRRQTPPCTKEIESWMQRQQRSNLQLEVFPAVAKYRLSLHALLDRSITFKVAVPELDVNTVDIWLPMAVVLNISRDQINMIAAQQSAAKLNAVSAGTDPATFNPTNLERIFNCIDRMNLRHHAAAAGQFIFNQLPPGPGKVMAARKRLDLACALNSSNAEDTLDAHVLKQCQDQYLQLAVEQVVIKYQLATHDPQYLALTKSPQELVEALYRHPKLDAMTSLGMPDINGAVSEICAIAELNKSQIQYDLVEHWLSPSNCKASDDLDETVNFSLMNLQAVLGSAELQSDISQCRALYILRDLPKDISTRLLLSHALTENPGAPAMSQVRALACLLEVVDDKTLQTVTNMSITDLRAKHRVAVCVSRLEALGYPMNMAQFNCMDKNTIVEGIWMAMRHNPQAVLLAMNMCLEFKSDVLQVAALEKMLIQSKCLPQLWLLPSLASAWSLCILYPFQRVSLPLPESMLLSCIHSVELLLYHCPINVSTKPVMDACFKLRLFSLLLCVAAADRDQVHDLQEIANKNCLAAELIADYEKMQTHFCFPQNVQDVVGTLV